MRVKEQQQREQEEAHKDELSFREWLEYYMNEPTEQELNDMQMQAAETNLCHPLQPNNNQNYNNIPQGA